MAKQKISEKLKKSSKDMSKFVGCRKWSPTTEVLDPSNLAKAIAECLLDNDAEGVVEVIKIYLETANIANIAKKSNLSRATLYHSLKKKNPTIKTLAKLIHAAAA